MKFTQAITIPVFSTHSFCSDKNRKSSSWENSVRNKWYTKINKNCAHHFVWIHFNFSLTFYCTIIKTDFLPKYNIGNLKKHILHYLNIDLALNIWILQRVDKLTLKVRREERERNSYQGRLVAWMVIRYNVCSVITNARMIMLLSLICTL